MRTSAWAPAPTPGRQASYTASFRACVSFALKYALKYALTARAARQTLRGSLTDSERTKCLDSPADESWKAGLKCYSNVNPAFTSVGTQFFKPATGSSPEIPAIIGAENDFEVLSLLALLVQKYEY